MTDQWYVRGSINDANGVVTETETFDGGSEFFKWGEVGWSPTKEERYTRNIHLVLWDVDKRKDAPIYNETYTVGFLRKFRRNADLLGLAVNWGDPPDDELRSQTSGELFYRV